MAKSRRKQYVRNCIRQGAPNHGHSPGRTLLPSRQVTCGRAETLDYDKGGVASSKACCLAQEQRAADKEQFVLADAAGEMCRKSCRHCCSVSAHSAQSKYLPTLNVIWCFLINIGAGRSKLRLMPFSDDVWATYYVIRPRSRRT